MGWCGLDSSGLGCGQMESSCEFGDKPSGSINPGEQSSGFTTGVLSSSAQLHRVSSYLVIHKQHLVILYINKFNACIAFFRLL
jgi:hypothetical protein